MCLYCTYLLCSRLGLGTDHVLLGSAVSRHSIQASSGGHVHLGCTEASHCLKDLGVQSFWRLQQVNHLIVVHFKKHSSKLMSQTGLHLVNEGDQTLSQHLFLIRQRSGGQSSGCQ